MNNTCTCNTYAVKDRRDKGKELVVKARKEGRTHAGRSHGVRECAREHVCVWTCKEQQRRRSKPKRENKLFLITIYCKKFNMPGFYGSFYGH